MAVNKRSRRQAYALSQPLENMSPLPIIANRAPSASDMAELGTLWIDSTTNTASVVTSVSAGAANWESFVTSDNLQVNTAEQISLESSQAAADAILLNASNAAGGIDINSGSGGIDIDSSGKISIVSTQGLEDSVEIISSAGGMDITATGAFGEELNILAQGPRLRMEGTAPSTSAIIITATDASGGININTGSAGLSITSEGQFFVLPVTTSVAFPLIDATLDAYVGSVTFTGFTIAAGSSQEFVIASSKINGALSPILVTASNGGGNDAQMTVTRVQKFSGEFRVTLTNNGAAALNGDIQIDFWIVS